MSPVTPAHPTPDDITFELLLLNQVAQLRTPSLPAPLAEALRESALWETPVAERPRRQPVPVWKAAVLAGLIALTPMAWLPVYADTQLRVGLNVIDGRSGKAIGGARVLSENGTLLGTTGPDGRITLVVPSGASDRFIIEKPGYRSFQVIRTQLRDNNLIAMLPAPKTATPTPTARPATPKPAPTAHATPHPVRTPHATPTPQPTERPVAPAREVPAETMREPSTAKHGYTRYRVKSGDSLWRIARREYGNGERWKVIYDANRDVVRRAELIQPGMTLKLPKVSARHALKGGWVMVRKGDSLYALAERHLGDGERWPEIYRANGKYVKNPRLIHPGQRLYIPQQARKADP